MTEGSKIRTTFDSSGLKQGFLQRCCKFTIVLNRHWEICNLRPYCYYKIVCFKCTSILRPMTY